MKKKIRQLMNHLAISARCCFMRSLPALYDVAEIGPTSCNIMLTNRCNLRCVMCRQWQEGPEEELSLESWKSIVDDLYKCGIRNIHLTGGEPLLRNDITEIIAFCRERGITVGMTTNGTLLNDALLDRLICAGLRSVAISVDALGESYERIRGVKNSFAKTLEALNILSAARKTRGIDVYVNFTLMKENIDDFADVKKLADGLEIPVGVCLIDKHSSIFRLEENRDKFWIDDEASFSGLERVLLFMRKELDRNPSSMLTVGKAIDFVSDYFKDPRQPSIPCAISQDRIFIDPYGNVLGGCLAMGVFGNLTKESFSKISSNETYRKAKRKMFYKECPGCSCGYVFNITHLPGNVLSYLFGKSVKIFSEVR